VTARVFLVGLGRRMLAHREALGRLPGVAVDGGFDPAPLARERWSATGLPVYRDLRAGLTEVAPDVVVVATPPAVRSSVIADVLDTVAPGLVVIEKTPSWLYWIAPALRPARKNGDTRRLGVPMASITVAAGE